MMHNKDRFTKDRFYAILTTGIFVGFNIIANNLNPALGLIGVVLTISVAGIALLLKSNDE